MLPKEIRERKRPPHALSVRLRTPALPDPGELAKFVGRPVTAHDGAWIRLDSMLVYVPDEPSPEVAGFPHEVGVEDGEAKPCFLAAYFVARRCGGVVWVQKRTQTFASAAFGEHYLADEDLEARWDRSISP